MNKFIAFDLDGTLFNTVQGITLAINDSLEHFGYNKSYTEDEIKKFLGHGARYLYQKATNKVDFSDEEYEYFQISYVKNQGVSEPFPMVKETLQKLSILGYKLIVYSNKPNGALQYLVNDKLGEIKWDKIQGNVSDYPTKPNPLLLNKIMADLKLDPKDGFYVGDSSVDCETAHNANLKCIILTYGYDDYSKINEYNPEYVIDSFDKIINIVR